VRVLESKASRQRAIHDSQRDERRVAEHLETPFVRIRHEWNPRLDQHELADRTVLDAEIGRAPQLRRDCEAIGYEAGEQSTRLRAFEYLPRVGRKGPADRLLMVENATARIFERSWVVCDHD